VPFNLYAAGSTSKESTDLKRQIGYPQLLSQYLERRNIVNWVEYLKEHPECECKLFVDSGAFTAHTKGIEVDVDSYIEFVNQIDDQVTIFAQVDKIAGIRGQEVTLEEQLEAPKLSWENYLYMRDRVKSRDKLLPVFHQGEDFKWLKNMLEFTHEDGTHIKYIGISPNKSMSSKSWKTWLEKVFKYINESSNPNVMTHAFGIGTLNVLEQFPFTSADSTTWLKISSYGSIMINGKVLCVSNRQKYNPEFVLNQSTALIEDVKKICAKVGITLEELLDDDDTKARINRECFNLMALKQWADAYEYKGNNIYKTELF
jgi:hypothetical protein